MIAEGSALTALGSHSGSNEFLRPRFSLRPSRDAGSLAPRDPGRRAGDAIASFSAGRAFRSWDLGPRRTRASGYRRSLPALPASLVARRLGSRSTRNPASRPGRPAVWSPCHSERKRAISSIGADEIPRVARDDRSHGHGVLGVMRGVARSAARAARGSGQRRQRAVNAISRKAPPPRGLSAHPESKGPP
jgi:hypothetical protein